MLHEERLPLFCRRDFRIETCVEERLRQAQGGNERVRKTGASNGYDYIAPCQAVSASNHYLAHRHFLPKSVV